MSLPCKKPGKHRQLLHFLWLSGTATCLLPVALVQPIQMSSSRAWPAAVLWDIDGTLVDSTELAWRSTNFVLKQNGFEAVSQEEYRQATKFSTPTRLAFHATKGMDVEIGVKLAQEFDRHYVQLVSPSTVPLFPGLQTLLEDMAKEGVVLGALSNACGAYVRAVLATHGWEAFRTQLGADEVAEAKPAPGGLLKCCELLALKPGRHVCYVGDSPGDGKAAKAAGLYGVGVRWGGAAEKDLLANFDEVVGSADELRAALARLGADPKP